MSNITPVLKQSMAEDDGVMDDCADTVSHLTATSGPEQNDLSYLTSEEDTKLICLDVDMLNVKNLSDLLSKNVHPKLYPRLFIMSPNGTLWAYATPTNIKELRNQAALISLTWRDHDPTIKAAAQQIQEIPTDKHNNSMEPSTPKLETLTVECDTHNVIVRSVQPQLLLVLIGGVPPNRKIDFKITAEMEGDAPYPPAEAGSNLRERPLAAYAENGDTSSLGSAINDDRTSNPASSSSAPSDPVEQNKHRKLDILRMHRRKLDALSTYIKDNFERRGFVMPNLEDLGKPLS